MNAKGGENHISVSTVDLDDLIHQNRVRPSLLVGVLDCAGRATGFATSFLPSAGIEIVDRVVDECSVQEFNDGMRSVHGVPQNEDIKETLKFHRDISATYAKVPEGESKLTDFLSLSLNQLFKTTRSI